MATDKRHQNHNRLRAKVVTAAADLGYIPAALKGAGLHGHGWPDLTLVHRSAGKVVHLEVKTGQGRVTPLQEEWLARLSAAGNPAWVVRESNLPDTLARLENYAASSAQLTLEGTR